MAKYRTVRTPSPGELWRQGFTYYVVLSDGNFKKLQFELAGIVNPSMLQQRIQQTCLMNTTRLSTDVYYGQDGWICLADNWVDYVLKSFQQLVKDFKSACGCGSTLAQCEAALSRVMFVC